MERYSTQLKFDLKIVSIIQAILLIEENAINLRMDVKFIIPIAPTQALINILIYREEDIRGLIIIKGISFCHDIKIKTLIQDNPSLTSGSQKNNGNAPSFVKRARLTIS